jgi:hypothetical protein
VEEVEQVLGILPRGLETDDEGNGAVQLGQAFEAWPQEGITGGRLGELQLGGGWFEVVAQEDGVMALAGGVEANAEAARQLRGGRVVC